MPTFTDEYPFVDHYPLFDKNSWAGYPANGTMIDGWIGDEAFAGSYDAGSGSIEVYNGALIWLHEGRAYLTGRFYWYGPGWARETGGYAATELLTAPLPAKFRPIENTDLTLHVETQHSASPDYGTSIVLRVRTDGTIGLVGSHIPHSQWDHVYNASTVLSWAVTAGGVDAPSSWVDLPTPNTPWTTDGEHALHTNRHHLRGDVTPSTDILGLSNIFGASGSFPVASSIPDPVAPDEFARCILPASDGRRYLLSFYSQGLVQLEGSQVPDSCPVAELRDGSMYKGAWDAAFIESGYTFHLKEAAGAYAGLPTADAVKYSETSMVDYGIFIPSPFVDGLKTILVVRYSSPGTYYGLEFLTAGASFSPRVDIRVFRMVGGTRTNVATVGFFSVPSTNIIAVTGGWRIRPLRLTIQEMASGHRADWAGFVSGSVSISAAIAATLPRGREGYATQSPGLTPMRNAVAYTAPTEEQYPSAGVSISLDDVGWAVLYSQLLYMMVV